jgi:hypothetical protein
MSEEKKVEFTKEKLDQYVQEKIKKDRVKQEKMFKEKYNVREEEDHLANTPIPLEINGKTYYISAVSLGVQRLVFKKVKELLTKIDFNFDDLKEQTKSKNIMTSILAKIWQLIENDEYISEVCEIIALIVNNKDPRKYDGSELTAEDLEFGVSINDLIFILQKVINFGDVERFLAQLLAVQQTFKTQG